MTTTHLHPLATILAPYAAVGGSVERTPNPWRLETRDGVPGVVDPHGTWIITVWLSPHGENVAIANAAFIARACNAHDEVVKALETARAHIRDEIGQFGARSDYADTNTIATIDAALALASGDAA